MANGIDCVLEPWIVFLGFSVNTFSPVVRFANVCVFVPRFCVTFII